MTFYAHSLAGQPKEKWEPLYTGKGDGHLEKVAEMAAKFTSDMFLLGSSESNAAKSWGGLSGLWHDLGKFSINFQKRLEGDPTPVDHSTAGAKLAEKSPPYGPLLSYIIAGHHSGLPDGNALFFEDRFKKILPEWEINAREHMSLDIGTLPAPPVARQMEIADLSFTLRMLFSCLVDADFLATEAFMQPKESARRPNWPTNIFVQMEQILNDYYSSHFPAPSNEVELARSGVRSACLEKASHSPGFFSLTVPTGGGKTLASLSFALRHTQKHPCHNFRRIIYVIPYTSIIEQNADIFREIFSPLSEKIGHNVVLEHHSNFESEEEGKADQKPVWRMASENWNAPLITTTNVQFFESLYANKTSRCRKLHNIARSVIILDEAQAIPTRLLKPILKALECLVRDFGCTVVFCTATQPALNKRDDFMIGIENIQEIISEPKALQATLKRVIVHQLGPLSDEELTSHLFGNAPEGALLVVNTTKAASDLHQQLSSHVRTFHLSARMCPTHRRKILSEIKDLRKKQEPCVLVSTQLIEAGVDISFPVVYRAECGIDSLAQAAGRCNRHGERGVGPMADGRVYFFQPLDHPLPSVLSDLRFTSEVTQSHILQQFADLLSLDAVEAFFRQTFWLKGGDHGKGWDHLDVLGCFPNGTTAHALKTLGFASAAEKFQMIPQNTHPVIIPWGEEGLELFQDLKSREERKIPPSYQHYRKAQQFAVQVYNNEWSEILKKSEPLHDGAFIFLSDLENNYCSQTGLKRENSLSLLYA
jgi:CRISPR-associated endonuclease/helicase Cas3